MGFFMTLPEQQRWGFIKENKKVRKQENKNSTKKVKKKKSKTFFLGRFLVRVLVFFQVFLFLDRFLGRVLVFLFLCFLTFLFSYFLVFFYKFPALSYRLWQINLNSGPRLYGNINGTASKWDDPPFLFHILIVDLMPGSGVIRITLGIESFPP